MAALKLYVKNNPLGLEKHGYPVAGSKNRPSNKQGEISRYVACWPAVWLSCSSEQCLDSGAMWEGGPWSLGSLPGSLVWIPVKHFLPFPVAAPSHAGIFFLRSCWSLHIIYRLGYLQFNLSLGPVIMFSCVH